MKYLHHKTCNFLFVKKKYLYLTLKPFLWKDGVFLKAKMAIKEIIIAPNALLNKVSSDVLVFDGNLESLVKDMFETMYEASGIGLSAVQIGILQRVIVVDVKWPNEEIKLENQYIMINPKVVEHSHEKNVYEEGCLSFPSEGVKIARPKTIEVEFLNIKGERQKIFADGLFATCIQHEIDHLNGITIASGLSHLKKQMMFKRIKKHLK